MDKELNIKRNSPEFKLIKELFDEYENKVSKRKLFKLFTVRRGDEIPISSASADGKVVFDLTYGSIGDYLRDRAKKLFRSPDKPVYYFKSSGSSKYQEFPFELRGALKKKIAPFLVKLRKVS